MGNGDQLTRWIRASDEPPTVVLAGRGRLAATMRSDFVGTGAFVAAFSDARVGLVFFFFFVAVFPPDALKLFE